MPSMVPANLRCSLELCSDFIIPFRARGQECARRARHGRWRQVIQNEKLMRQFLEPITSYRSNFVSPLPLVART